MQVKFLDIQAQYPLIEKDIRAKFDDIINSGNFVGLNGSKYLSELETLFAAYCDAHDAIGVANGTSALWMILFALNIGPGDEVIVPVNTFIATAEAVTLAGATPVFADIESNGYNIDPNAIASKITKRTKAIIPVHMYGQCADMNPILDIAKAHNLLVIEDASQAHGASYKGRKAGSMGVAAAFSFYAAKNLGAWGDGGAISTSDIVLATKLRAIRNHGSQMRYRHDMVGGNFRLDEFQSGVLSTKMAYLDSWNAGRRRNAELYQNLLKDNPHVELPNSKEDNLPVWHLFVIRIKDRENFMASLQTNGIQCAIHYPTPLHLTQAYAHLGYTYGNFPVSESAQSEIVSLPMYAELTAEKITYVCKMINNYFFK